MGAAADPALFSPAELDRLHAGHVVEIGGKRYRKCTHCGQAIRIDGWTGALHLCRR